MATDKLIDDLNDYLVRVWRDLVAVSRLAGYEPYSQKEYERARRTRARHARRQQIINMWAAANQTPPQE